MKTSERATDPLLAILRGLHDAIAMLAGSAHWRAARARKDLEVVDRLLKKQEETDRLLAGESP